MTLNTITKIAITLTMTAAALAPMSIYAQNTPSAEQAKVTMVSHVQKASRISVEDVDNGMEEEFSDAFLKQIRSGSKYLYFSGSAASAKKSLSEIVRIYCDLPGKIQFYDVADATGTYLEITEACWPGLKSAVDKADRAWDGYRTYVADSCETLNLNASDASIVDQINDFICENFSYEVTNSGMPAFLASGKGQCWHYAKLFADMCNSVGIPASKIQNTEHAWNIVTVDHVQYTFDVTYNDTCGNRTLYSWTNPTPLAGVSKAAAYSTADYEAAASAGWQQQGTNWLYRKADGRYAKNQWVSIQGFWYYFDGNGAMCTSKWVQDGSSWYYVKADGTMAVSCWIGNCWVNASGIWQA